ncbi:MAG: hypothetical protein KF833_01425 [Verrucomicrobiae bacterium]|nr:hypothetical protein [Verrucomicrobiae bacterium]
MNHSLALPGLVRPSSWWLALLLPVMPVLAGGERVGGGWASLLTVGIVLAFGLPALVVRLPWAVRKEVDQLRPAWLASLFAMQMPYLVLGEEAMTLLPWLFAATCALMAAIPFGTEFQQRTLAGMLAQPVDRAAWWRTKMTVLAVGLGVHWAVAAGTAEILGAAWAGLVVGMGMSAVLAGFTTPYWTLLTRGLLSGLVFSLAIPMLGLAVVVALLGSETLVPVLLLGLYVVGTGLGAWRRWRRMEAKDEGETGEGLLGLPRLRTLAGIGDGGRAPVWATLARKELRLQAATWWLLLAGVALAMPGGLAYAGSDMGQALAVGGGSLLGLVVLLAGATAFAEERRLGVTDGQRLQPVAPGSQWWIKMAIAALPVLVVILAASWMASARDGQTGIHRHVVAVTIGMGVVFVTALLMSSGTGHPVRAVIAAMGVLAFVVAAAFLTARFGSAAAQEATGLLMIERSADPEAWRMRAERLDAAAWEAMARRGRGWRDRVPQLMLVTGAVPAALGVFFAWRNFVRPGDAGRRLPRQGAACLGLLVALWGGVAGMAGWASRSMAEGRALGLTRQQIDLEARLSPAERLLLEQHGIDRDLQVGQIAVTLDAPSSSGGGNAYRRTMPLPLGPRNRRLIIQRGNVAESLREALRAEAVAEGEPADVPSHGDIPPLPVRPARPGTPRDGAAMSPELMQRFGGDGPGMSPELMRRYGLQE